MANRIHPTAIIEDDVTIGDGSAIYDNVHIRHGAQIGEECLIGGKSLIAYEVNIGNRVKINSNVYVCHGVTIEDGVMISAGTTFTNDRFPRATTPDLKHLRSSDPDGHTLTTLVRAGATIGANSVVGSDLVIGRFAMVGMGSVVTRSVPDFHLVVGNPAHSIGCVCRCGELLLKFAPGVSGGTGQSNSMRTVHGENLVQPANVLQQKCEPGNQVTSLQCTACGLRYRLDGREIAELTPPDAADAGQLAAELLSVWPGLENEQSYDAD